MHSPPARFALVGQPVHAEVLIDSEIERDVTVSLDDRSVVVGARQALLLQMVIRDHHSPTSVTVGDASYPVSLTVAASPATVHLKSNHCQRWSVADISGQSWFPDGVLQKWDAFGRPFFHGSDCRLSVPAGTALTIRAARGMEFRPTETTVTLQPHEVRTMTLDPVRLFDPPQNGWFGADLHVHMNYGGTMVCEPEDATRMQRGEGLHLMNLVAANCATSLVYDREVLEALSGADLPGSTTEYIARAGVEYRNDLLGHFHATAPVSAPTRYATGHAGSDNPEDWPPNAEACDELRELGATIGYCHPIMSLDLTDDSAPDVVLGGFRTMEAREVVADAALGLVDSIDVVSNGDFAGSAVLYRRMLGAGLQLAASAGTDSLLSFARFGTYSNPPGWARVYAAPCGATQRGHLSRRCSGRTNHCDQRTVD